MIGNNREDYGNPFLSSAKFRSLVHRNALSIAAALIRILEEVVAITIYHSFLLIFPSIVQIGSNRVLKTGRTRSLSSRPQQGILKKKKH